MLFMIVICAVLLRLNVGCGIFVYFGLSLQKLSKCMLSGTIDVFKTPYTWAAKPRTTFRL